MNTYIPANTSNNTSNTTNKRTSVEEQQAIVSFSFLFNDLLPTSKVAFSVWHKAAQEFKAGTRSEASLLEVSLVEVPKLEQLSYREDFFSLLEALPTWERQNIWYFIRGLATIKKWQAKLAKLDEEATGNLVEEIRQMALEVKAKVEEAKAGKLEAKVEAKEAEEHETRMARIKLIWQAGKEPKNKEDINYFNEHCTPEEDELVMNAIVKIELARARKEMNLDAMEF